MTQVNRQKIGVHPSNLCNKYSRLFGGLEELYEVHFEPFDTTDLSAYDSVLLCHPSPAILERIIAAELRAFVIIESGNRRTQSSQVCFSNSACLNERLRGHKLSDSSAKDLPTISIEPQDEVLARSGDDPIWVQRRTESAVIDFVSIAPAEPSEGDFLRQTHLTAGCFIRLLPLVHFLRDVCAIQAWTPPPLRACFIFDDPNLHRFAYGFLNYKTLVEHTQEFNYHAAIATIPLDSWWVDRSVAEFVRAQSAHISWLIHGNNHAYHELNQTHSHEESLSILAQSLARTEALEQKAGIPIPRIMVPPHGTCSAKMMQAMVELSFDAVTMNPMRNHTVQERMLAGWTIADMGACACPLIPRFIFASESMDIIPLLAFLDQPLIYTGHHDDAANQMVLVEDWVSRVNAVGDVQWQSIDDIARSNYLVRIFNQTLHVRMHSRHIVLNVPEEVDSMVVEVPAIYPNRQMDDVQVGQHHVPLCISNPFPTTDPVSVNASSTINIRLRHPAPISHLDIPHTPTRKWAIARRLLTEMRDRVRFYPASFG